MKINLDGQVAIVTGGSSGIGYACLEASVEAGAAVDVNYHSDRQSAEALVKTIKDAGGRAIALAGGGASPDDVERMVSETVRAFGRLDIMLADASIQRNAGLVEMWIADWDTNFTGQVLCAQAAIRQFLR